MNQAKFDANKKKLAAKLIEEETKEDSYCMIVSQSDREADYPWLSEDTLKIKDVYLHLHNEILDFVRFVSPTPEEKEIRRKVVKKIKEIIQECYPEAMIMIFGSCATGLNLPNSDIDLLVYNPSVKEVNMIHKITDALLKANACKSIEPLRSAKVPIIKL